MILIGVDKMIFYEPDSVYCSLISSYNVYQATDLTTETVTGKEAKILRHIKTGEEFQCVSLESLVCNITTLKYMKDAKKDIKLNKTRLRYGYVFGKWSEIIFRPCEGKKYKFIWPLDMIDIPENEEHRYYLIFNLKAYPEYERLSRISRNKQYLGLENPNICEVVRNYIDAFIELHNSSFMYVGFDDDNILINSKNKSLLFPFIEYMSGDINKILYLKVKNHFSEVIDPYAYLNRTIDGKQIENDAYLYDFNSEMYAFTSILFRLLVGLYPYEGMLMAGNVNNYESDNNYSWITKYVESTIFIFDPEDKSNSIDVFNEYKINVKRWNSLPDEIKNMFIKVFNRSNVLRENSSVEYYSPSEWKTVLEKFDYKLK